MRRRKELLPGPVHPRACGEHTKSCQPLRRKGGSSPRLRGTRGALDVGELADRFIPAPAGNTLIGFTSHSKHSVHPRACGEHEFTGLTTDRRFGSSPRLRGTLEVQEGVAPRCRFIPAPAGNTKPAANSASFSSVHPRACGEHSLVASILHVLGGSSPRLRGTHVGRSHRSR